jgi:hypothetical protein
MVRGLLVLMSALTLAGCATQPPLMTTAEIPGFGAAASERVYPRPAAPTAYRPLSGAGAHHRHGARDQRHRKPPAAHAAGGPSAAAPGGFKTGVKPTDLVTKTF